MNGPSTKKLRDRNWICASRERVAARDWRPIFGLGGLGRKKCKVGLAASLLADSRANGGTKSGTWTQRGNATYWQRARSTTPNTDSRAALTSANCG